MRSTDVRSPLNRLLSQFIEDERQSMVGEILSRPLLAGTDGRSLFYVADVKISGNHDEILRSVPIAKGNRDLIYADAGQPVTLTRHKSGRLEITGFAKRKPGNRRKIPINLSTMTLGPAVDVTLYSRRLTYGELATLGGYGFVSYGALGMFRGSTLLEIR